MRRAIEPSFDVVAALAPVRRSIGIGGLERWTLRGLTAGALLGAILLLIARLAPFALARDFAFAALPVGVVAGIVVGGMRWPTMLEAARAADRHFRLKDRLTTALELRGAGEPLAGLQRLDTAQQVEGLRLAESRGRAIDWREGATGVLSLALLAALLAVGVPRSHHPTAVVPNDTGRVRGAATRVPVLLHRINQGLTPDARQSAAVRRLDQALARLQQQLLRATSRPAALRTISATQLQLQHLAAALHPISLHAAAQLNHALGLQSRQGARQSAAELNRAASGLNRLAQSISHMSARQRAALAARLARAANGISDRSLRAALHQAASSLAYNDPQTASSALQQAASALAQSRSAASAKAALQQTNNQLDSLKNQVSGLNNAQLTNAETGTPAGKGSSLPGGKEQSGGSSPQGGRGLSSGGSSKGATGAGRGSGRGSAPGQGQGTGRSAGAGRGQGAGGPGGLSGQNQGSGQSRGLGRGPGGGSAQGTGGPGGSGSHGTGGGTGGSGPRGHGRYATVYTPYTHQGRGPQTVERGPTGAPLPGSFIPYGAVLQRYSSSAHQALTQTSLPPSLQQYVRSYFSAISH